MIHNRYSADWLHRIAIGLLEFFGVAAAGATGCLCFPRGALLEQIAGWLLLLSPVAGVVVAPVNPRRFSLAEGLAGASGYDELR
jgi:hypothetical protein